MRKQIISVSGKVLFSDEEGSESTVATIVKAIASGANLSGANLSGADLRRADLSGAVTDKRYVQVGCIGSAKRLTTYCFDTDTVWCGGFTGTLAAFEDRVNTTHKGNLQYLKEYLGAIAFIKSLT